MCGVCDNTADDRGHVWQKDSYGEPDFMAFYEGCHNGYRCVRCGYIFCHHCEDGPQEDCTFKDQTEMPV